MQYPNESIVNMLGLKKMFSTMSIVFNEGIAQNACLKA
jgi:ribosomal protein L30/L7E